MYVVLGLNSMWFLLCKEPRNIFDCLKLQHTHQNMLYMFLLGTIGMPGFYVLFQGRSEKCSPWRPHSIQTTLPCRNPGQFKVGICMYTTLPFGPTKKLMNCVSNHHEGYYCPASAYFENGQLLEQFGLNENASLSTHACSWCMKKTQGGLGVPFRCQMACSLFYFPAFISLCFFYFLSLWTKVCTSTLDVW